MKRDDRSTTLAQLELAEKFGFEFLTHSDLLAELDLAEKLGFEFVTHSDLLAELELDMVPAR